MPNDLTVDLAEMVDLAELAAQEGVDIGTDPYPVYAWLRERGPVHRVRLPVTLDECWLIVGHEEARAALTDDRLTTDVTRSARWEDDGSLAIGRNMLQVDAAGHARLRKLVAREFTVRRVQGLRPRIQQVTDELLDAIPPSGKVDLIESLAMPLPMVVICELLGVPGADRDDLQVWSDGILKPSSAEAAGQAIQAFFGYFAGLIQRKRNEGGDDLLSALVRVNDEDGDRLSDDELLGMVFLLFVAGYETTAHLISGGVLNLLRHPDQLEDLRADWSLLEPAVEEMLRYGMPVQSTAFRFTTEPVTIEGTEIPAGEPVLVSLAAPSRSPGQFARPDQFDIHRPLPEIRGHMAFGHGAHHCIGAPLGRLEATIAIRALLERFPALRLDAGAEVAEEVVWRPNAMLRGPSQLPVMTG